MHSDSPPNQSLNRDYFLRLGAALAIFGIIWFGQNYLSQKKEESNEAQNFPALENFAQKNQPIATFAATLPIAQNVFLIPQNDIFPPIRNWDIKEPEFSAQSIYSFDTGSNKILLQKEPDQKRPIASLSKLITALVILEKTSLKDEVIVSKTAVETLGEAGGLVSGEKISVESLIYAMLLESSNDAAVALAEKFNGQFIGFMNQKTKDLGLKNTILYDPSGLNPENVSSAKDLVKIIQEIIKIPFLNYVTTTKEIEISSSDGSNKRRLININKLLEKYSEIIAAKTGYIDEAGGCMAVALKSPNSQGIIINVILGSADRFADMENLIEWERKAFVW